MNSLIHSPTTTLLLTLVAYLLAQRAYQRWQRAWLQPVLITILVSIAWLVVTGLTYADYAQHVSLLHSLLGPATVALAIPLYRHLALISAHLLAIVLALVLGLLVSVGLALLIAAGLGASPPLLLALTTKSVTTPIALALAEQLQAAPALAATFVMFTGILGAIVGPGLLRCCGIHSAAAQGFALGLCAHGVGTARAYELNERSAAFASVALGLAGLLTACTLPYLVSLYYSLQH